MIKRNKKIRMRNKDKIKEIDRRNKKNNKRKSDKNEEF